MSSRNARQILSGIVSMCFTFLLLGCPPFLMEDTQEDDSTVIIADEVVVVEADWEDALTDLDEDRIVYEPNPALSESVPFEPGDVVAGAEHGGYLRRVTSVESEGNQVIVNTEQASLDEAIIKGDLRWSGALDFASPSVAELSRSLDTGIQPVIRRSGSGTAVSLGGIGLSLGNGASFEFSAGDFYLEPSLELRATYDHGLKDFEMLLTGDFGFDATATVELSSTVAAKAETILLDDIPIAQPILLFVGPVPITLHPELDLILGAEMSCTESGTLRGGVASNNSAKAGFSWSETAGLVGVFEKELSAELLPIEAAVNVNHEIRMYFKVRISLTACGFAGPYVALAPYVSEVGGSNPEQSDSFCNDWYVGISGELGAHLETFWGAALSSHLDLLDFRRAVYSSCSSPDTLRFAVSDGFGIGLATGEATGTDFDSRDPTDPAVTDVYPLEFQEWEEYDYSYQFTLPDVSSAAEVDLLMMSLGIQDGDSQVAGSDTDTRLYIDGTEIPGAFDEVDQFGYADDEWVRWSALVVIPIPANGACQDFCVSPFRPESGRRI